MQRTFAEYLDRYPDEAAELSPRVLRLRSLAAGELGAHLWCHAILRDAEGRVFERKAADSWLWSIPGMAADPSCDRLSATADRALACETGLPLEEIRRLPRPSADAVEVVLHRGGLRLYFVVDAHEEMPPFPAEVARTARWAPTDFLWNQRLAGKLAALRAESMSNLAGS